MKKTKKPSRDLHVRIDEEVWELLDRYRFHLGHLRGGTPPATGEVIGAIVTHFFLTLGEEAFQGVEQGALDAAVQKVRPVFDRAGIDLPATDRATATARATLAAQRRDRDQ